MTTPTSPPSCASSSQQRILVLDGAMGTMIQRHGLGEADFRGERFARSPARSQGQQRPPRAHAARRHRATSTTAYLEAGADIIETNTFNVDRDRAGRLRARGDRLRAERRGGAARARRRPTRGRRARPSGRASSPARSGPTNRTLSISPERQRPGVPRRHLRRRCARPTPSRCAACSTAASTCSWSRRSSTRSTPRPRSSPSRRSSTRRGVRAAGHDLGHHHRPQRPHALGPDGRGVLDLGRARAARSRVGINCALGAARDAARTSRSWRAIADVLRQLLSRTPACPTRSASTTSTPETTVGAARASSPTSGLRQHRRRLLRHDARAHPRPSPTRCAACAPRAPADAPTHLHALQRARAAHHPARDRTSS